MAIETMTERGVRCGNHRGRAYHFTADQVRKCYAGTLLPAPRPQHDHPTLDPTMRMFCEPCGCVHSFGYDTTTRGYRCTLRDDTSDCPACIDLAAYRARMSGC